MVKFSSLRRENECEEMTGNSRKNQKGERCEARRDRLESRGVEADRQEYVFRGGWIERVNRGKGGINGAIAACSEDRKILHAVGERKSGITWWRGRGENDEEKIGENTVWRKNGDEQSV